MKFSLFQNMIYNKFKNFITKKTISLDVIGDYGNYNNDLAFLEVKNAFLTFAAKYNININNCNFLSTKPFNTIENTFIVSQLAFNKKEHQRNYVIFHNVAPRKDNLEARIDNDGEKLGLCILKNGTIVIGVISGFSFSFLQNSEDIYILNCITRGSQFRSRDIFPEYTCNLINLILNNKSISKYIEKKITNLPKIPNNTICYIDGYGNIKTNINIDSDQLKDKKEINITINNITQKCYISNNGVFAYKDGDLILSKGSSGWNDNAFVEIFLRGGNASELFNNPEVATNVILSDSTSIN